MQQQAPVSYLTTAESARQFGISRQTLVRAIRRGAIAPVAEADPVGRATPTESSP